MWSYSLWWRMLCHRLLIKHLKLIIKLIQILQLTHQKTNFEHSPETYLQFSATVPSLLSMLLKVLSSANTYQTPVPFLTYIQILYFTLKRKTSHTHQEPLTFHWTQQPLLSVMENVLPSASTYRNFHSLHSIHSNTINLSARITFNAHHEPITFPSNRTTIPFYIEKLLSSVRTWQTFQFPL